MKKIVSLILSLLLCVSILPHQPALAANLDQAPPSVTTSLDQESAENPEGQQKPEEPEDTVQPQENLPDDEEFTH